MHWTDFSGCQQCSIGTRIYDPDCGLYYCDDGECNNTDTTGYDDDDSGSDSSDSGDSDSGDSGTVYSGTPSPTRSHVESDTDTTGAFSTSETTRVVRVCTDGYFEIVSVSRRDNENGETSSSGYPEFQLDSDEYNVIGYVSDSGDFVFEYTDSYDDTYYFMLICWMSSLVNVFYCVLFNCIFACLFNLFFSCFLNVWLLLCLTLCFARLNFVGWCSLFGLFLTWFSNGCLKLCLVCFGAIYECQFLFCFTNFCHYFLSCCLMVCLIHFGAIF